MLLQSYTRFSGVRANFVLAADGSHQNSKGNSRGIGGPDDRALLVHLRSLSDVIVTDAATARAEAYGESKFAPIIVLSASSNFAGITETTDRFVHSQQRIEKDLIVQLQQSYGPAILLELGKTTLTAALKLSLVDELCLTVVGEPSLAIVKSGLDLKNLIEVASQRIGNVSFLRFALR